MILTNQMSNNTVIIALLEINRSSPSGVFLRKGVLKICSKFTDTHVKVSFQYSCKTTLLKSHFVMGVPVNLLYILEHFFLRVPLNGCF